MGNPYAPPGTNPPRQAPPQPEQQPQPQRPQPPRQPDPVLARRTNRRALWFGMALLLLMLTTTLRFPWNLSGVVVAMAAVVIGIATLSGLARARVGGLMVPALVIGLGLTGVYLLQLVSSAVLWDISLDYQQCRDGAITQTAQEGCKSRYEETLQSKMPTPFRTKD